MTSDIKTKNCVVLETTINDFTFRLTIEEGANYGSAYQACWAMLARITELAKESVDKAKPQDSK